VFIAAGVAQGQSRGLIECCVLQADVVGFTALTERLAADGDRGRERLGDVLARTHRAVGRIIAETGGSVASISGDGVLVLFPGDTGLRAVVAAAAIRDVLASGEAGKPLATRIGLARGKVVWTLYRTQTRAAYGLEGSPILRASMAEQAAKAGEILADVGLAASVSRAFYPPNQDGFSILCAPPDPPTPISEPRGSSDSDRLGAGLLPVDFSAWDAPGEFREVISAFVCIPDSVGDDDKYEVVETILNLSEERGGFGWRLDQGVSGSTYFLFWGAPVAHEHDLERAIGVLRALMTQSKVPLKAGASLGLTYAGFVGTESFQDYACLGESTNRAARLAHRAPSGSFWIDAALADRVSERLSLDDGRTLKLKGIEGDISAYSVNGDLASHADSDRAPFRGREALRARLSGVFAGLADGAAAGGVLLEGPPGIGKSHLAEVVVQSLPQSILCLRTETNPVLRGSLVPCWDMLRPVLRDPEDLAALRAATRSPHLAATLSRTAAFLAEGLGFDTTPESERGLDPEARARLTRQGLVAAILAIAETRPLLLHVEDIHWLDDDSRSVIASLLRRLNGLENVPAIGILMTARPRERHLPEDISVETHQLDRLEVGTVRALVEMLLGGPASGRLQRLVMERSAGVPLFVTQLVKFLQESDLLTRVKGIWHLVDRFEAHRVPTDTRALLVSRLDRLSRSTREAVVFAAVLGRGVSANDIGDMATADGRPLQDPGGALAEATSAGILVEDGGSYVFSHALFRDAAYETQLTTRREELHRLAAQLLETRGAGSEILAQHYDRGGLRERAIPLHLHAGETASAAFQNEAAIWHLGRALDLVPEADHRARFNIASGLDRLFLRIGDHVRQEPMLDLLDEMAGQLAPVDRLIAALARADYLAARSRHPEAITTLEPLIPVADRYPDSELCIRFYRTLAYAYNYTDVAGRIEAGTAYARTAVSHAERNGDPEQIALAMTIEAAFYRYRNDPEAERLFRAALQNTSDLVLTSRILHRLGSIAFRKGAQDEGYRLYDEAMQLAEKTGDMDRKGGLGLGLAFQAEREGDIALAIENYRKAMSVGRELNQPQLIMEPLRSLAHLAAGGGRISEAERMYQEVANGRGMDAAIANGVRGWHCLLRSDWQGAEAFIGRFETWATEMDFRAEFLWIRQTRSMAFVLQGRLAAAREMLPKLDAAARDFVDSVSYGQSVDRASRLQVHEVFRAVIEGQIELGSGALGSARNLADKATAALARVANAPGLIDVVISGVAPGSADLALAHDLLARLDHPEADRVLLDAKRRLNDLADRYEAAGYDREGVWREDPFRAYLMGREPGQPGRTLVRAFADQRNAPASTRA
jgi:class 3 adenylate cyclase/tetratricopeptide (TPR) repeat protein